MFRIWVSVTSHLVLQNPEFIPFGARQDIIRETELPPLCLFSLFHTTSNTTKGDDIVLCVSLPLLTSHNWWAEGREMQCDYILSCVVCVRCSKENRWRRKSTVAALCLFGLCWPVVLKSLGVLVSRTFLSGFVMCVQQQSEHSVCFHFLQNGGKRHPGFQKMVRSHLTASCNRINTIKGKS